MSGSRPHPNSGTKKILVLVDELAVYIRFDESLISILFTQSQWLCYIQVNRNSKINFYHQCPLA